MLSQRKCCDVLDAFVRNNVSISEFILSLLQDSEGFLPAYSNVIEPLFSNANEISAAFASHSSSWKVMRDWANRYSAEIYARELRYLTSGGDFGLKFNASNAQIHQVTSFNTEALQENMRAASPFLWALLLKLLTGGGEMKDQDKKEQKIINNSAMFILSRLAQAANMRCNRIGTIIGIFLHSCNAPDRIIDALWRSNSSISVSSIINAIRSLSDDAEQVLKSSGKKFMYSYVVDNFDVQLKHKATTVEQSTDTLFHLTSAALVELVHTNSEDLEYSDFLWACSRYNDMRTVQVRQRTMQDLLRKSISPPDSFGLSQREHFNAWKFLIDLCTYGPEYFRSGLSLIEPPDSIEKIPPVKTNQIPARAMDLSNATVDGNINAAEDVLRQGGVEDTFNYVIPFHGDLGTYERMSSARGRRSIERTPLLRMQYMIFIPGVFHTEMACADALYRLFLGDTSGRSDETSIHRYIEILYPNDSSRIANGKGSHQMMCDSIYKSGIADRLECWRVYAQSTYPGCDTLEEFAGKKPSFEDLAAISRKLATTYNSSSFKSTVDRRTPADQRDQQYENVLKRIELFLLFEETIYSIRHGDVGRMESCFIKWIPIFKGTGKHKYAHMLLEFLLDVHFTFPTPLKKAIRYNWLCNPKGTETGFRGVDWLLELNNLLTKVIYGGRGSNHTVDRIIKESILIQLYRDCKKVVEDQFLLTPKSMRHGTPDYTQTIATLSRIAVNASIVIKKPGRTAKHCVPDAFDTGMARYHPEVSKALGSTVTDKDEFIPEETDPMYEVELTEDDLFDI